MPETNIRHKMIGERTTNKKHRLRFKSGIQGESGWKAKVPAMERRKWGEGIVLLYSDALRTLPCEGMSMSRRTLFY